MAKPLVVSRWSQRWLVLPTWDRLHRVAEMRWDNDDPEEVAGEGRTVCGRVGRMCIPGVFSRLGLARCRHCCRLTGTPPGDGNPYNAGIREPGDPPRPEPAGA